MGTVCGAWRDCSWAEGNADTKQKGEGRKEEYHPITCLWRQAGLPPCLYTEGGEKATLPSHLSCLTPL